MFGRYMLVVEEYDKLDELRKKRKAEEVMAELIAKVKGKKFLL
jgi:hypothetical protein